MTWQWQSMLSRGLKVSVDRRELGDEDGKRDGWMEGWTKGKFPYNFAPNDCESAVGVTLRKGPHCGGRGDEEVGRSSRPVSKESGSDLCPITLGEREREYSSPRVYIYIYIVL